MSNGEQQSLFPLDGQEAQPPVDPTAASEYIAAHAGHVEYTDRTSDAARDQGFGQNKLPLGIERPTAENDGSSTVAEEPAADSNEPKQSHRLVEPTPTAPKPLTSAQKNANYRRHLEEHMRVVGPSKRNIEPNYG